MWSGRRRCSAAVTAAEAGNSVVVLQKQSAVVSQGNAGSGVLIKDSDPEGLLRFIHHTNSVCNWRSDPEQLKAYVMNSGEAISWLYKRGRVTGTTKDKPNDKGLFNGMTDYTDFTGAWTDHRYGTFNYGDSLVRVFGASVGPKPNNAGTFLGYVLDEAAQEFSDHMKLYYSTPGVQLIQDGKKSSALWASFPMAAM